MLGDIYIVPVLLVCYCYESGWYVAVTQDRPLLSFHRIILIIFYDIILALWLQLCFLVSGREKIKYLKRCCSNSVS